MKNEISFKLDAAFNKHQTSNLGDVKAKEAAKATEQSFLKAFLDARDNMILPAMEEVGEFVKAKGYSYEISTEDDEPSLDGQRRSTPASIRFTMFLSERRFLSHEHPGFSVICEKSRKMVRFHQNTTLPGRAGQYSPAGETTLDKITDDLIQQKILKVIAEVFRYS